MNNVRDTRTNEEYLIIQSREVFMGWKRCTPDAKPNTIFKDGVSVARKDKPTFGKLTWIGK